MKFTFIYLGIGLLILLYTHGYKAIFSINFWSECFFEPKNYKMIFWFIFFLFFYWYGLKKTLIKILYFLGIGLWWMAYSYMDTPLYNLIDDPSDLERWLEEI
jgi:hypothetical protein